MRLVFMGTPEFALPSLRRLAQDRYDIVGVYTRTDQPAGRGRALTPPPVKTAALDLGLVVFQPPSLRPPEAVEELTSLRPDVIVVCAFGQILRQPVLDIPPKGVVNVHPSLLPRHRGATPIQTAILAGDEETGVTIMLADAGMDTGPILSQRSLAVSPWDSAETLNEKLSVLAADLLGETLPLWLHGRIEPQPQDEAQATYTSLIGKEDAAIDWTRPAVDIWRQVRAMNPSPGAYTLLDGEMLHIWKAWPLPEENGAREPGTVLALSPAQSEKLPPEAKREAQTGEALAVQTGEGLLVLLRLQRPGRRVLPAIEFARGQRHLVGHRLGPVAPA
jgi:methionyl-tRNA formyltransferase